MVQEQDYVALFQSTHRVLAAEKLLKAHQVPFRLIPAPREMTAACGLALLYSSELAPEIGRLLAAADLQPTELFIRAGKGFRKLATEL